MTPSILFLHGFTSSPLSSKAVATKCHFGRLGWHVYTPDLTWPPKLLDRLLEDFFSRLTSPCAVFGSSLGGFYAARLAHRHGLPAVLLNPCTNPWAAIPSFVGEHEVFGWPGRKIVVTSEYAADFRALARETPVSLAPEQRLLVLSDRDEVVNREETLRIYGDTGLIVSHNDEHRLQHYETHLDAIEAFLRERFAASGQR